MYGSEPGQLVWLLYVSKDCFTANVTPFPVTSISSPVVSLNCRTMLPLDSVIFDAGRTSDTYTSHAGNQRPTLGGSVCTANTFIY